MHTTTILIVFTPAFLCGGYLLVTSIVKRLSQYLRRRPGSAFTAFSFYSRNSTDEASQSSPVSMAGTATAIRSIEKLVPALSFRRRYVSYSSEEFEPAPVEENQPAHDHSNPSAYNHSNDIHSDNHSNGKARQRRGGAAEPRIKNARECAVCLCAFQEDERVRVLPTCRHAFHVACIDTWLYSHWNCPLCREEIKAQYSSEADNDDEEEEEHSRALSHQEIITDQPDCSISMPILINRQPDIANDPSNPTIAAAAASMAASGIKPPHASINTNQVIRAAPLAPNTNSSGRLSYLRSGPRRCLSTGSLDLHLYDGSDQGTASSDHVIDVEAGAISEIIVGLQLHQHQQHQYQPSTSSNVLIRSSSSCINR